jgi:hypothetical protein
MATTGTGGTATVTGVGRGRRFGRGRWGRSSRRRKGRAVVLSLTAHHLVPGGAGEAQRPPRGQPPRARGPVLHGPPLLGDGDASRVARSAVLGVASGPGPDHLLRRSRVVPRGRLLAVSVVAEGAGEGTAVGGGHRGAAIGAHGDLGSGGDGLEGVDLAPGDGALGPRDRDFRARRGPVDLGQGGDALRAATSQGGPVRSRTCVPRVSPNLERQVQDGVLQLPGPRGSQEELQVL